MADGSRLSERRHRERLGFDPIYDLPRLQTAADRRIVSQPPIFEGAVADRLTMPSVMTLNFVQGNYLKCLMQIFQQILAVKCSLFIHV